MSSKRVRFITLAGAVFVILVIGVSLLLGRISMETRRVSLPDTQTGASASSDGDGTASPDNGFTRIEVTKDTVQTAIGTLQRPVSYSRSIRVTMFFSDGSAVYDIETYVLENAKAMRIAGPETEKRVLIADGDLYVWEDGADTYFQAAFDTVESDAKLTDMYQMLVTYEDILALDPSRIAYADYKDYNGEMCIIVRYQSPELGYLTTCYISVRSGLLIHASQYDGSKLVYEMDASAFLAEVPDGSHFTLPDGTSPIGDV